MTNVIIRPKSINIGISDEDSPYEWFGIDSINYSDSNPWEHIEIPSGPMVHQHIHSPHIKGEIRCTDLDALYTALFSTYIDDDDHTAIDATTLTKTVVGYFNINVIDEKGNAVEILLDGFRVETLGPESIKLGKETVWIIKFTADLVTYVQPE